MPNYKLWCAYSLVLLLFSVGVHAQQQLILRDVHLKPQQVRVFLTAGQGMNADLSLSQQGRLWLVQGDARVSSVREFTVLGPFKTPTDIQIALTKDYTHRNLFQLKLTEITKLNPTKIADYRLLFLASQLWYKNSQEPRQQAIKLLQQRLELTSKQSPLTDEIALSLAHMTRGIKDEIAWGYLNKAAIETLVLKDELALLQSSITAQLDNHTLIAKQCQYLDYLSSARPNTLYHRFESIKANVKLAISLIEYTRHSLSLNDSKRLEEMAECHQVLPGINKETVTSSAKKLLDSAQLAVALSPELRLETNVFGGYWHYYNVTNEHVAAEKVARLAISEQHQVVDLSLLRDQYSRLATSLIRQGDLLSALYYLRLKLNLVNSAMSGEEQSAIYFNLAYNYRLLGEKALARRYFKRALAIDELTEGIVDWQLDKHCTSSGINTAMVISQLGILDRLDNNLARAYKMHLCARNVFSHTDQYYEIVAMLETAKDELSLGLIVESKVSAQQVLADPRVMQPQRLDALLVLLELAIIDRDNESVEQLTEEMSRRLGYQNIYQSSNLEQAISNYPVRQIQFFELLVRYYSDNVYRADMIRIFGDKALSLIATINANIENTQAWSAAQYSLLSQYIDALFQKGAISHRAHYPKIFEILERYYSIDLTRERLKYVTNMTTPESADKLQRLWAARLDAQRAVISASSENRDLARSLADAANDQYRAFLMVKSEREIKPVINQSIKDIQRKMPVDDIFIRYFIDRRGSFSLVITKTHWSINPLADQAQIRKSTQAFMAQLDRRNYRQHIIDSDLSSILPLKLLRSGQYRRLIFVADDTLHKVPFSALNIGTANNHQYQPLINNVELIRAYSAQNYYLPLQHQSLSRIKKTAVVKDLVMFADPIFKSAVSNTAGQGRDMKFKQWLNQLPRLHHTAREAATISKLFSINSVITALEHQATNQFLMSDIARRAKILHIATHGYFNPKTPDIVGLVTAAQADDNGQSSGFLSLEELLSKPFYNDLVVISGCETMLGQYYKGSGNRSIIRGLLSQGATSVIGTLWQVADRPTAQFMTLFYRHLKQTRGNIAKALQLTKQQFAQYGRYRHPKYWAGFVLTSSHTPLVQGMD